MIIMPHSRPGHRCSSQAKQTSGTPQAACAAPGLDRGGDDGDFPAGEQGAVPGPEAALVAVGGDEGAGVIGDAHQADLRVAAWAPSAGLVAAAVACQGQWRRSPPGPGI